MLILSEDATTFFIDRTFFAETHAFVTDKFYSEAGKIAHNVQSEVEVIEIKQLGATLSVEITFEQTLMYRSRSRMGSSTHDTQTEGIIRGPFLQDEGKSIAVIATLYPNTNISEPMQYLDRLYYIKLLNRNVLGLVVADVTIPRVVKDSGTTISSENNSNPNKSKKLLWSLAGVFIGLLLCCFGSGVIYFKQVADAKTSGDVQVTEHLNAIDDRENLVSRADSSTSAETGVPLIPAYRRFNQDDSVSIYSQMDQQNACSVSSRLTFVSANSSLSTAAEAINLDIPLGRLRMELNYPDSGWPKIQAVDISSVAYGYVDIGDRLAFIDGHDVRTFDEESMAILMDEFCNHMRRLTVFRNRSEIQSRGMSNE